MLGNEEQKRIALERRIRPSENNQGLCQIGFAIAAPFGAVLNNPQPLQPNDINILYPRPKQ